MEAIPTLFVVIDNNTEEELLNEEDNPISLPEHDEIEELVGSKIMIVDKEYTIVEATTEPSLNSDCDMVGVHVILRVE